MDSLIGRKGHQTKMHSDWPYLLTWELSLVEICLSLVDDIKVVQFCCLLLLDCWTSSFFYGLPKFWQVGCRLIGKYHSNFTSTIWHRSQGKRLSSSLLLLLFRHSGVMKTKQISTIKIIDWWWMWGGWWHPSVGWSAKSIWPGRAVISLMD